MMKHHSASGTRVARFVAVLWIVLLLPRTTALRIQRPWSTRHWCEVLFNPHFPFAYAKVVTQGHENKGVVVDNSQHLGHICTTRGARTKCYRCEDIDCGSDQGEMCHFQVRRVCASAQSSVLTPMSCAVWNNADPGYGLAQSSQEYPHNQQHALGDRSERYPPQRLGQRRACMRDAVRRRLCAGHNNVL